MSRVIVTCIHGTWARGSRWPDLERSVTEALRDCGPVEFRYFEWSGRNSVRARTRAVADLRRFLLESLSQSPGACHVLIAHSHGANIVLHALDGAACPPGPWRRREPAIGNALAGVVLLSPSLLHCRLIGNPAVATNKLLLGAMTVVPLFLFASRYARLELGISSTFQLAALLMVIALWLALFRPARVRRRAATLARQLALPRLEFPGLVVRSPHDEATAALSSVAVFAAVARYAWSRILRARTRVHRNTERHLREARSALEVALAVGGALALVHVSVASFGLAQKAAEGGQWISVALVLAVAIVFAAGALVIVGGAVLLLLLLPALSVLLWPFGIRPTIAAALLAVSVEDVPAPGWRVIHVGAYPQRRSARRRRWKHSTYCDPAALEAVSTYVRGVVAPGISERGVAAT